MRTKKTNTIPLKAGNRLHKALKDYAKRNNVFMSTLIWTSLAAQHPELREAIMEDRI